MAILGRILLVTVVMALVVESAVAWNLFDQARSKPREPITVGERVQISLTQPSPITNEIEVVLKAPIDAPTPADRMPPPLHPSHRKAMQNKDLSQKSGAKPAPLQPPVPAPTTEQAASVDSPTDTNTAAVVSKSSQRPIPPPAPTPRAEAAEPVTAESNTGSKKAEQPRPELADAMPKPVAASKSNASARSGEMTPQLRTEAAVSKSPAPPMPNQPVEVAANVPAPGRPGPFGNPKPESPKPAIPPFERPAPGNVTVDPVVLADAVRRLQALGAAVTAAIDREGRELPERYTVTLDPNPNGDAMTRLNLQLQNQLGRAIADMGDSLHTLTLRNLGLGNLNWISNCPGLNSLDLTGSNFLNIEPLTRLPRLEVLNVTRTHVDNMILASMIRNLRVLNLGSAGVVDIAPLGNLQGLEELYLTDTRVRSIDAVARLPRLKVLDISGSRVTDLRPLKSCLSLRRIGLARTGVTDLTVISECGDLVGLDLSGCVELRNIDALGNLTKLEVLSLFGVPVEHIDALTDCGSLHTLELSRTAVRDLAPLANLKQLRELYLRGLNLEGAGPLTALPELKTLDVTGTTFMDARTLADLRNAFSGKALEIIPADSGQ